MRAARGQAGRMTG